MAMLIIIKNKNKQNQIKSTLIFFIKELCNQNDYQF